MWQKKKEANIPRMTDKQRTACDYNEGKKAREKV